MLAHTCWPLLRLGEKLVPLPHLSMSSSHLPNIVIWQFYLIGAVCSSSMHEDLGSVSSSIGQINVQCFPCRPGATACYCLLPLHHLFSSHFGKVIGHFLAPTTVLSQKLCNNFGHFFSPSKCSIMSSNLSASPFPPGTWCLSGDSFGSFSLIFEVLGCLY